jgi:hypothetical protein
MKEKNKLTSNASLTMTTKVASAVSIAQYGDCLVIEIGDISGAFIIVLVRPASPSTNIIAAKAQFIVRVTVAYGSRIRLAVVWGF